ncbi:dihydrodipicolinate synthase family protein [Lunatibacter salilacus]|uniref:dihydrodipicolinate synthase family protein n=1 Tax=Lunatibacter salilacus TaxID=2483804 RepID=UPI001F40312C|nr:dihydrodipicolinate synthase family protein [Lunatibacter salilacus]
MPKFPIDPSPNTSRRSFLTKVGLGLAAASMPISIRASQKNHLSTSIISMNNSDKIFIPVMLTTYHQDGTIDYDGMSRLMDFYLAAGAKGFFANCLSSEMYLLTDEEKLKLTKHVVEHVNGKIPVVASGSFGDTINAKADFTKRIKDTGVDAVILISGHFAEKEESDTKFIQHLDDFMLQTEGIHLGTYECPSPYKRIISPEIMKFLVDSGRFIYHKDTTEDIDQIKAKIDLAKGGELGLYNAHIGSAAASLQYGGAGLSPIAGNFYPEIITWMCENATDSKKKTDVDWLQKELREVEKKIGSQYQLGARYFLSKRGFQTPLVSRGTPGALAVDQAKILDDLQTRVRLWHERLGI